MSDAVITTIITSVVSLVGVITGFVVTILYNKKKFEKMATNEMKHVELDPNGETMHTINAKFAELESCVEKIENRVEKIESRVGGIIHLSAELNGILKDKNVLTHEQTARLNNHLDND